jgi:hypothetical protein
MCRITNYRYTCTHHIEHIWSSCRGQVKATKTSNTPACQKCPSIYLSLATKCGSCVRAEAEQSLRRDLHGTNVNNNPTESTETALEELEERLTEINARIPTANWRPLPSPVYSRKPSQKRLHTIRKHSLLRDEFKPEEACGPEAWEDNVVLPVYEAVDDGWNFEWTSETKSLAEELAEDQESAREMSGVEEGEVDENDDLREDDEVEESDDSPPSEPQATTEADLSAKNALVQYRFRRTTPGRKAERRIWEVVVLTA